MKRNKHIPLPVMAALLASALNAQLVVKERPKRLDDEHPRPGVYKLGSTIHPDLQLRDVHGRAHRFGELRGKVVFLHFWSKRCPGVQAAQARLSKIHRDFAGADVVVLGVDANQDEIGAEAVRKGVKSARDERSYGKLRGFAKKHKVPYPILVDHGNLLSDLLAAKTTPHCFVIDQAGVLRYRGALDNDPRGRKGSDAEQYVRDAIGRLLAGQDVANFSTRPYGRRIERSGPGRRHRHRHRQERHRA